MKKNMVRALAFALVVIMALSILPLASFAATVGTATTEVAKPAADDLHYFGSSLTVAGGSVIKTSDYDSFISFGDDKYDIKGVTEITTDSQLKLTGSIRTVGDKYYAVVYGPHVHKLFGWYGDATNHWKYCPICHENLIAINWHYDGDRDRYCDVCGDVIVYYDITVKDCQGGKVIIKEDTAPFRDRINVEIQPDSGYQLGQVHFYKVRPDGSRSELTRNKVVTGQSYWFSMPSFKVEVEADFVKY